MSDLTATAIENQFHDRLIDKFFHPKSYFYYCLKKYLRYPIRLSETPQQSVISIISQLVESLTRANSPLHELQEIARIRGLDKILVDFSGLVSQFDFKIIPRSQVRATIDRIAYNFLKTAYQTLLENEKGRNALVAYLNIKLKLAELLNDSNGKGVTIPASTSSQPSPSSDIVLSPGNGTQTGKQLDDQGVSDSGGLLRGRSKKDSFEQQVSRLLNLIVELRMNITFDADFMVMRSIEARFVQMERLAENYRKESVRIIAHSIAQLLHESLERLRPADQKMVEVIDTAVQIISRQFNHPINSDQVKQFFDRCRLFLSEVQHMDELEGGENRTIGEAADHDRDQDDCFEINAFLSQIPTPSRSFDQPIGSSPIFSGFRVNAKTAPTASEPGYLEEDDEEVLKLSHGIAQNSDNPKNGNDFQTEPETKFVGSGSNNWQPAINDSSLSSNSMPETPPEALLHHFSAAGKESDGMKSGIGRDAQPDNGHDQAYLHLYQQEADWYFKVMLAALKQLKNQEKIQTALEDIELASSSLKRLARKFGADGQDELPELLETISMFANQHIIKLPPSIIQTIEDGVNLFMQFDRGNIEQQASLKSIVAKLDEFSRTSMKQLPKN